MLNTEVNEFVLEFRKMRNEGSARKPIFLTRKVAEEMSRQLRDKDEKYIDRHDDNGDFLETIDKYEVKGIKKLTSEILKRLKNNEDQDRFAVCEYGGRHKHLGREGFEECECEKEFGVSTFVFEREVRKQFPNVEYHTDITPKMRIIMRRLLKKD